MYKRQVVVLAAGGLALAFRGRLRDCAIFCLCGAGALAAGDPALCFAGLAVAVGCLAAAYFTPGERLGCATLFLVGGLLGVPVSYTHLPENTGTR